MVSYNSEAPLVTHIADECKDLHDRFVRLDEYLVDNVHPLVGQGSAAVDDIWLTDHGPKHISTVIRRIGDLTYHNGKFNVSSYEAYLLAVAAHFHDVGNVFGRDNHETHASSQLFDLEEALIGQDLLEKRKISKIARVHGGRIGGSKDTINTLPDDRSMRKLAAILRFADELADDYTRTSKTDKAFLNQKKNEEIRKQSELYHIYAERLTRVRVDHGLRGVILQFDLLPCHLCRLYFKDGQKHYLIDEIFARTLKVHREQIYCAKFMAPEIVSEVVDVQINVCSPKYERVLGQFHYTLEQKGYPDHIGDFHTLVADYGLGSLRGQTVADRINEVALDDGDGDRAPVDLNKAFRDLSPPMN